MQCLLRISSYMTPSLFTLLVWIVRPNIKRNRVYHLLYFTLHKRNTHKTYSDANVIKFMKSLPKKWAVRRLDSHIITL